MSTFTEETLVDRVEAQWVDPTPGDPENDIPPTDGRWVINVRRVDRVLRTGRQAGDRDTSTDVIAAVLHRHVVELTTTDEKGQTIAADLSAEDPIVQKIAAVINPQSLDQAEATPQARPAELIG